MASLHTIACCPPFFVTKTCQRLSTRLQLPLNSRNRELYLPNMAHLEVHCVTDAGKGNTFYTWLKCASLKKFYETLSEAGITEVSHLEDGKEEDPASLGLSKFEQGQLVRLFAD